MKGKNVFWGLFFIVAAGVIVAHQLGYMAGITTLNLILTILIIPIILKSITSVNFFGIFFPLALLGILFAEQLGITEFVPVPILIIALFISLGLSLIFSKFVNYKVGIFNINAEDFEEIVDMEDEETVKFGVKFGSSIKYINSQNLKQANLSSSFGELVVYFDNTTINEKGAVINVDVSFGAITMYIPKEWKVINGISATLAGVEEHRKRQVDNITATIKLAGRASFAGVEIIYI